MKDLGIEAVGCHANRCAGGAKPYDGMSVEERNEIRYRLIVDIAASGLFAVTSFFEMDAYAKQREYFSEALVPEARQYNEAHIHAVRQCIQHMCLITEEATVEPITFVVDRNQEFGKRAKAWYEASQKNPAGAGRHHKRFGPYLDGERLKDVGLQGADLLAYAALRHELGKPCWQWDTTLSGVKIGRPFTSGEKFWSDVAEFEHASADKGRSRSRPNASRGCEQRDRRAGRRDSYAFRFRGGSEGRGRANFARGYFEVISISARGRSSGSTPPKMRVSGGTFSVREARIRSQRILRKSCAEIPFGRVIAVGSGWTRFAPESQKPTVSSGFRWI